MDHPGPQLPELMQSTIDAPAVIEKLPALRANIGRALLGKDDVITLALAGLLAKGHLLIEDVPGIGKTTLARAIARSIDCAFHRVQFTSDLLPSDILGVTIYNQHTQEFEFKRGPIFANVVLADEINRATPKSQSALLEAMSETQVSVDGVTYPLSEPFWVLATQNPIEYHGTYPLPEAQLDRFLLRIGIGYPDAASEQRIMTGDAALVAPEDLSAVITREETCALQADVPNVRVDPTLLEYALTVVHATRTHGGIELGASPRAAAGWYRVAQAFALLDGRDYCVPDDFTRTAVPALAHRLVPALQFQADGDRSGQGPRLVTDILADTPLPR